MPSTRARYNDFIARHEVAWELSFAALAVVFVSLAFIPYVPGSSTDSAIVLAEWVITAIFVAEFSTRIWAAPSRSAYLRGHWIDLISCIPPTRFLRWFRLFRLLRLVRAFAGVGRALTSMDRLARHKSLVWLVIAWIGVMLLCTVGLYVSESGVNENINGPLDALWWGLTTMTTVGYGDVFPTTPEGRLSAAVLMILGIGLYAAITATVTSFMISSGGDPSLPEQLERLSTLYDGAHLSDAEYQDAKAAVIAQGGRSENSAAPPAPATDA